MSKRLCSQLEQEIPEDVCCEIHLDPPQLFCHDDQITIRDKYFKSQEHKNQVVYGVQEAAENYRKLFQEILNTLKEELEVTKSILADEQGRMVMMQEEEQNFKVMIESEYRIRFRLTIEENKVNFQNLQPPKITAELEKKCGQSASASLQNARYSLERSESLLLQCLEPARITDLSLRQITGMSKMLKVLQSPVTLDPKTAHPRLVLSEDLRSVRLRDVQQDVAGHPERFDLSATTLGVESFTSGWHLPGGGCGKGNTVAAGRLIQGSMMGTDYTFWAFPPLKRVSLREQMHRAGVFLDYEYGQISFYDVTKRSLIYNFSYLAFQGALRPIFSLRISNGGMNSDSLSICLPHVSSCNGTQPSIFFGVKSKTTRGKNVTSMALYKLFYKVIQ
uniref:B30.2/SPRY domain-containing protein n=1 Tax=Phocoena sinus TaxID=42100 RepID=A0A8C9BYB3_PHOSS